MELLLELAIGANLVSACASALACRRTMRVRKQMLQERERMVALSKAMEASLRERAIESLQSNGHPLPTPSPEEPSYRLGADPYPYIECRRCHRRSYHPSDRLRRYCGFCHHFHTEAS